MISSHNPFLTNPTVGELYHIPDSQVHLLISTRAAAAEAERSAGDKIESHVGMSTYRVSESSFDSPNITIAALKVAHKRTLVNTMSSMGISSHVPYLINSAERGIVGASNVTQNAACLKYQITRCATGFKFLKPRSHVSIARLGLRNMDFTVSLNFIIDEYDGSANYLFDNNDHKVFIRDDTIVYRHHDDPEILLYSSVTKDEIHTFSFTMNGNALTTWLNHSNEFDFVIDNSTSRERNLIIGNAQSTDRPFRGSMNFIYVLSRPLKISQIKALNSNL